MRKIGLIGVLLMVLAACGGQASGVDKSAKIGQGDAEVGRELFNKTQQLTGAPTCSTCHVVNPGEEEIVAPNLSGIALRAGQRVLDQSAEDYLYASIVDPYAYVINGYQDSIMVRNYGDLLTEQQLADLVAYLMTLE